jgi:hypothetical protein
VGGVRKTQGTQGQLTINDGKKKIAFLLKLNYVDKTFIKNNVRNGMLLE